MLLGIFFGFIMLQIDGGITFITAWIKPLGTIFVKLLKLIAVPLILASLIKGISDLKDISKFTSIGLKTIIVYVFTTIVAICIGLTLVNIFNPGDGVSDATIAKLTSTYINDTSVQGKIAEASRQQNNGPLDFVVDMVPENAFSALSNNKLMLQVGISLLLIGEERSKPLKDIFDSLNVVVLKMVDLIMLTAPYAVFALLANVVVSSGHPDLLYALLFYASIVIAGLILMVFFYLIIITFVIKKNPFWFLKQISPAQLLAFSTSSSDNGKSGRTRWSRQRSL